MKRMISVLVAFLLSFVLYNSLYAMKLSVGANAWYNWWHPAWSDGAVKFIPIGIADEAIYDFHDFSTEAGLLYGPALSLRLFNRLSVSTVFMYGNFNYRSTGLLKSFIVFYSPLNIMSGAALEEVERDVTRWDSDTVFSYSLTPTISLFTGFKAQGYSYKELYAGYAGVGPVMYWRSEVSVANYGPGFGFSMNIPIWENLFLQYSGSVILLFVFEEYDYKYGNTGGSGFIADRSTRYLAWGATSSVGLIYLFPEINISIKLGFRYQFLNYRQTESQIAYEELNNQNDHIYGLTFAAVYTFDFGD